MTMTAAPKRGTKPTFAGLAALALLIPACAGTGTGAGTRKTPAPANPTASAAPAPAPATSAAPALPPGVLRIRVGTAVRDRSATGIARCMIPEPLPAPPRFEPETAEIAYTVEVDPQMVKAVTGKVVGDLGCPDPWTEGCAGYTVCGGGVCQNQFGATLKCPGDKPLKKGSYTLSLTVGGTAGGKTVEVPFEIQ
jgi:hypothetical protein